MYDWVSYYVVIPLPSQEAVEYALDLAKRARVAHEGQPPVDLPPAFTEDVLGGLAFRG